MVAEMSMNTVIKRFDAKDPFFSRPDDVATHFSYHRGEATCDMQEQKAVQMGRLALLLTVLSFSLGN